MKDSLIFGSAYTNLLHGSSKANFFDNLPDYYRPLVKSAYQKIIFLIYKTKIYVVGTQKNCLNETVLLSTQNTWSN